MLLWISGHQIICHLKQNVSVIYHLYVVSEEKWRQICSREWSVLHFVLSCEAFIKDDDDNDDDDGDGWLDKFMMHMKRSPSVAAASRPAIMYWTVVKSVVFSVCSHCSVRDEPSVKCESGRSLTDLPNGHTTCSWEHVSSSDHCRCTKTSALGDYWVVRSPTSPAFSASLGCAMNMDR